MSFTIISATQFQQQVDWQCDQVVDVRSPDEHQAQHLTGAVNLPLETLAAEQLSHRRVYLVCKMGKRAAKAADKIVDDFGGELFVVEGGTDECVRLGMACHSTP